MVGNCFKHGMPTEKREWSLNKSMKCENPSGENAIKVRQCPNCYKVYEPKTRECPYCHYIAEPTLREIKQEEKAELEHIKKIEKYQRKNEIYQCKTYGELVAYAKSKGYKNPRAVGHIIFYRQGKERKMEIKINNNNYKFFMLPPDSIELKMEDGNYHTGVTDFHKKEIYIADNLNKDTQRYTIIHELTHAMIDSYGFMQVEWNDEIVADFMGNYFWNLCKILTKIENNRGK